MPRGLDIAKWYWQYVPMTNAQNLIKADELEAKADMLDMALLAPSMKSQTLRDEAARLRKDAA